MSWEQAMKEAYASSPIDEVELYTLELRHSRFRDEFGEPTTVRVVQGYEDVTLGLEDDAPVDPGKMVLFKAVRFALTLPRVEENAVPELQITISNVSREITKHLEEAIAVLEPISVTFRPYLASVPEHPQMNPPLHLTLKKVKVDVFQVTGTASLEDVHNWPFPFRKYLPDEWPGLKR
ncbi:DUF1833 family protein [Achromobacter xylosoxidans]|uniref:Uncharacterized protein n=1 Tax=Achromobacter phage JWX TaxID=1589746 RepID=A0A0B5A6M7_9CAUD|nr:DUF1833 family protein [Achromobacter xylosoxidans]YP_009196210.1 minor tail protein [Achromobacter phage JWX]AJD82791.1 hypothetical protein JWX_00025 [Achromobacter phage JWX]WLW38445.1 minor tail protein [Achromobacter phage JWT]